MSDPSAQRLALGPLAELLDDPDVTEIFVDAHDRISVVRKSVLEDVPSAFAGPAALLAAIRALLAPSGHQIDAERPMINVRLADRARLTAAIPPVSPDGPVLALHKVIRRRLRFDDLLRFGAMTPAMADFLRACVVGRCSIFVSGGTNSGKTTLMNCLCDLIPPAERLIVVERQIELQIEQRRVVRLEAAPGITMAALITQAIEMRPERLLAGELSGGEALGLVHALITGHEGSIGMIHATSPADALARLEVMATMAELSLPLSVLRRQIAEAFQLVVQIDYGDDRRRRVTRISEVVGIERDQIALADIFRHDETGFYATGHRPGFLARLQARGAPVDPAIFTTG